MVRRPSSAYEWRITVLNSRLRIPFYIYILYGTLTFTPWVPSSGWRAFNVVSHWMQTSNLYNISALEWASVRVFCCSLGSCDSDSNSRKCGDISREFISNVTLDPKDLSTKSFIDQRHLKHTHNHYDDAIISVMASQIIKLTIVYLTVFSGTAQRKH